HLCQQLEGAINKYAYAFNLEFGHIDLFTPHIATLLIDPGPPIQRALICPKCRKRRVEWHLYCIPGRGWACSAECIGIESSYKERSSAIAVFRVYGDRPTLQPSMQHQFK